MLYRVEQIQVTAQHPLYEYFTFVCLASRNLYNSALFRERQIISASGKDDGHLQENERFVLDEIASALPLMGKRYAQRFDKKRTLDAAFMMKLFHITKQPDYCLKGLSSKTAQQVVMQVVNDIANFHKALVAYHKSPDKFKARPKLPRYKDRGALITTAFTNQACKYLSKTSEIKFPKTALKLRCRPFEGCLKEVKVVPHHGIFSVCIVYETNEESLAPTTPRNVAAIDLGVNNLAAIANNLGKTSLLFKGTIVKSLNQVYNKEMAKIRREHDNGNLSDDKYRKLSDKLGLDRLNRIGDMFHKVSRNIVDWCFENDIDTIVIGKNEGWKQKANTGKRNNQTFVSIPFNKLEWMIQYKANVLGISVLFQEESYTSKASFLDDDPIPVIGDAGPHVFSGRRISRGNYRSDKSGTCVNADLNAAANIGRKAFPALFETSSVNFNNVQVIVHPGYDAAEANRRKQIGQYCPSKSKLVRQCRKKSNPFGVGFCG